MFLKKYLIVKAANILSDDFDDYKRRLFQKNDYSITADGSEDNLIQPGGLP